MAHKIAFSIQKGGVGKSTTTVITAEILAEAGFRVLVLDLDSQGNATSMVTGNDIYQYSGRTILEAMKDMDPEEYLIKQKENLHILPAEDMLITFSRYLYSRNVPNKIRVLRNTIEKIEARYDFILMDCPPALGDITLNAIAYADHVIIPVQLGGFCLTALDRFADFLSEAKNEGHTKAEILGIVFTIKDRSRVEREIAAVIRENYQSKVFTAEIRKRAKLKEFSLVGTSMNRKDEIDALEDYLGLVEEIITRLDNGDETNEQ